MGCHDPDKYIEIVASVYDTIADAYFEYYRRDIPEVVTQKVDDFESRFRERSSILELGCGNGLPFTAQLAVRYDVTALDVSSEQINRARKNVPEAALIRADMTSVEFPANSFAGVLALYSIIHVPRERHAKLFESIYGWLKPGGIFSGSFGHSDSERWIEPDWFGASMYWSHFDPEVTQQLVGDVGFEIESSEIECFINPEDGEAERHLWIVARKPED